MGLFIMSFLEDKLLAMDYEIIIQFMNELPKTNFFNSESIIKQFRKITKRFNITQELMDQLTMEYNNICLMSKEYKNSNKTPAVISSLYMKTDIGKYQTVYFPS